MKILEFIIEKVTSRPIHKSYGIYKNPTQEQINHTSTHSKLKTGWVHQKSGGLIHGNDLYMWHPEQVHETSVRKSLGLKQTEGQMVTFSHHNKVIHLHDVNPHETHEAIFDVANHPHVQKMFPKYVPTVDYT